MQIRLLRQPTHDPLRQHVTAFPCCPCVHAAAPQIIGPAATLGSWHFEGSAMDGSNDDVAAAMQAYRDRQATAARRELEQEHARQEIEMQRMQHRSSWGSVSQAHSIASLIVTTVMGDVGDDIARQGSPILFRFPPQADPFSVLFELHEGGQLPTLASLRFAMDDSGLVAATGTPGLQFPPARAVNEVDRAWVADIARATWKAALAR